MAVATCQASGMNFIKQFITHQAQNRPNSFATNCKKIFIGIVQRSRLFRKMTKLNFSENCFDKLFITVHAGSRFTVPKLIFLFSFTLIPFTSVLM